jgi:TetR/AcrR family transcriptional regulator, transcriptional repressor of bet genes
MELRAVAAQAARDQILEAALDELVASDGDGVTMKAVADRAGVALRTLYNHFSGRDELLTAAYLRHANETRAAAEAVTVPETTPEAQLRHVVAAYYSRYAEGGERLTALLALRGFLELDHQIREIRAWRRRLLHGIVDRARRAGDLAMPTPRAVALAFTMTSHAVWRTLVDELDGDGPKAILVGQKTLSATLFDR